MAWWSFWKKRGSDLRGKRPETSGEAVSHNSEAQTQPQAPAPGTELSVEEMIAQALRPALFLRKTPNPEDPGAKGCWLGGEPSLPSDIDWPYYEYEDYPRVPMHFLAQIELSEMPQVPELPEMPRTGTLFFFVEPMYAPVMDMNGGCKVIYSRESCLGLPARPCPEMPSIEDNDLHLCMAYRENPAVQYAKWNFRFEDVECFELGTFDNRVVEERLLAKKLKVEGRLEKSTEQDRKGGQSEDFQFHRMFGDDGLGANRISGQVPLLTIGSDADVGTWFGDVVPVMFVIDQTDLSVGSFDRVVAMERYG